MGEDFRLKMIRIHDNPWSLEEDFDNGYELSVKADHSYFCEPKQDSEDINIYTRMEIAIFKHGEWVQPREDEYIQEFDRYDELIKLYQAHEVAVGCFIPIDLIQDLYDYLKK